MTWILVPCVASISTSTYLLISLVKGATEYLDDGVTAREKGKKRERGVGRGQREAGGRKVEGITDRGAVSGAVWKEEGRAGGKNIGSVGRGCAGVWDRPYKVGGGGRKPIRFGTYNI